MDSFFSAASKWFNEKTSSPLYFSYIFFFISWNWEFFQVIFLENAALFQKPRIEYIKTNLYFHTTSSSFLNWIITFVWHVFPPAVLTYCAIVFLPYIQKWALSHYLDNRLERMKMYELNKVKFDTWVLEQEKKHSKTLKEIASEKVEQTKSEEVIEKSKTNEEKWQFEYELLQKQGIHIGVALAMAEKVVYGEGGYFYTNGIGNGAFILTETVSLLDISGLIHLKGNQMSFTEKGKYFLRIYKGQR